MNTRIVRKGRFSDGFTLVEVVITMALLLIIMTILIGTFGNLQRQTVLKTSADDMVVRIRDIQFRAISGTGATTGSPDNWGVRFDTDSYTTFQGSSFSAGQDKVKTTLDTILEIDQSIAGCTLGCEIVFNKLTGTTQQACAASACQITVRFVTGTGQFVVTINAQGRVTVT